MLALQVGNQVLFDQREIDPNIVHFFPLWAVPKVIDQFMAYIFKSITRQIENREWINRFAIRGIASRFNDLMI